MLGPKSLTGSREEVVCVCVRLLQSVVILHTVLVQSKLKVL